MKRREFIPLFGGAATWPLAASAQQRAMPVIGFLHNGAPEATNQYYLPAFHKGLSEAGFVEGRDVAIEYHWARNENARLPELAADLVRRRVAVIATPGSPLAALAAKARPRQFPSSSLAAIQSNWVSSRASTVQAATSLVSLPCPPSLAQSN
jgi:putative ABC transport system substrate-binding protein